MGMCHLFMAVNSSFCCATYLGICYVFFLRQVFILWVSLGNKPFTQKIIVIH